MPWGSSVSSMPLKKKCRIEKLGPDQIRHIRRNDVIPVLNQLNEWLKDNLHPNLPSNPLQKAIKYMLKRWDGLVQYTTHGELLPDNNLIENQIRPMALGRKNYMFCGSHNGAVNAAILYSFLGTCKLNDIDPFKWLIYVFNHIDNHNINKLHQLLPIQQNKDRFQ